MSQKPEPAVIKKYANRRLYHTGTSTYITLEGLADMVKEGKDFVVVGATTGEDITRSILTQVIVEQENKGANLLPINFLRKVIRFYDGSMQSLLPKYLEASINMLTKNQTELRESMFHMFGPPSVNPTADVLRRNMEMFEQFFTVFLPSAQKSENGLKQGDNEPAEDVEKLGG